MYLLLGDELGLELSQNANKTAGLLYCSFVQKQEEQKQKALDLYYQEYCLPDNITKDILRTIHGLIRLRSTESRSNIEIKEKAEEYLQRIGLLKNFETENDVSHFEVKEILKKVGILLSYNQD